MINIMMIVTVIVATSKHTVVVTKMEASSHHLRHGNYCECWRCIRVHTNARRHARVAHIRRACLLAYRLTRAFVDMYAGAMRTRIHNRAHARNHAPTHTNTDAHLSIISACIINVQLGAL